MRIAGPITALWLLAGLLSAPINADAADTPRLIIAQRGQHVYLLPFPRAERAQSVWDSGACWSECGAQCAWGQNACLQVNAQGQCIAYTDACDRFCQNTCRSSGGPLLDITD
jgi:hypothetical protein